MLVCLTTLGDTDPRPRGWDKSMAHPLRCNFIPQEHSKLAVLEFLVWPRKQQGRQLTWSQGRAVITANTYLLQLQRMPLARQKMYWFKARWSCMRCQTRSAPSESLKTECPPLASEWLESKHPRLLGSTTKKAEFQTALRWKKPLDDVGIRTPIPPLPVCHWANYLFSQSPFFS